MTSPGAGAESDEATRRQHGGDLHKLGRGSTYNLAGSAVDAVLSLVLPVLVARGLNQTDAGIFFQVTALFTIAVSIGTVGADIGVVRHIPRALALHRPRDLVYLMRISFLPTLAVGLVLTAVMALLIDPIADLVTNGDPAAAATFVDVCWVLLAALPLLVAYRLGLAVTRALGSVRPLVVYDKIGRSATEAAGVAVVVAVSQSLVLVIVAWVAPYAAAALFVARWIVRRVRSNVRRLEALPEGVPDTVSPGLAAEFWRFSAPSAVSRIFSLALQRLDIIIVGAMRGPSEAAVYAAATRFPVLGLMFVQAIQQVMAPRISEFLVQKDRARALLMYRTTTCWLVLVSWPIYLFATAYADLLIEVFGAAYVEGAPAVQVLCLAMLVATACGPVDMVLLMSGRSGWSMLNTGLSLVVMVSLDLLLVPELGVIGAAYGWAAAILVNNLLPLAQVRHFLAMHPLGRATLTAMALALLSFGALPGAVALLLGQSVGSLLVAGVVGAAAFAAGAYHRRDVLEMDALLTVVRRRKSSGAGAAW